MTKFEIVKFLKEQQKSGNNWVAYDQGIEELTTGDLFSFPSAETAKEFCKPRYSYEGGVVDVEYPNCEYFTILSMLDYVRRDGHKEFDTRTFKPDTVLAEMDKYPVAPTYFTCLADLTDSLAHGEMNIVIWKRKIIPSDEIIRYHIIQHQYPRGTVYEMGHQRTLLHEVPDYSKGLAMLEKEMKNAGYPNFRTQFLLIGQFKGQDLQLSYDSRPEKNSGILLSNANMFVNDRDQYAIEHFVDPANALLLSQNVFAKMDPATQTLSFYDGSLRVIDPAKIFISVDPLYFRNRHSAMIVSNTRRTHHPFRFRPPESSPSLNPSAVLAEYQKVQRGEKPGEDEKSNQKLRQP